MPRTTTTCTLCRAEIWWDRFSWIGLNESEQCPENNGRFHVPVPTPIETTPTHPRGVWHDTLMCHVIAMSYSYENRSGTLVLPLESCTDMEGAVSLFTAIDPDAQTVRTMTERGGLDSVYRRRPGGHWIAQGV